MKTDNALRKALLRTSDELPYGFDDRLMRRILLEADRKGRLSYYRALTLVALVSLVLIAGLLVVLNLYFNINLLDVLAGIRFPNMEPAFLLNDQTRPILAFSIYIAALMLVLLGLDFVFRKRMGKSRKS